ncbi:MAG TPA: acyl-CoA dehydrogenase family protein [Candidatus Dormibacteraeota bacterium]
MRLLPGNTYLADPALRSLLRAWLRPQTLAWAEPQLQEMGRLAATELPALGDECERHPAYLKPVDPWGERVDEVVYPEAWRKLAATASHFGLAGMPYEKEALQQAGPEVRVVHAALCYLFEPGTATYMCPVSMTDAAARVLTDFGPDQLRQQTLPHLVSRDPGQAWTAGQWMTEQQGGSDVGANQAEARNQNGQWRLYGRKYFCSNVGGQVVLALARPENAGPGTRGLGLFLVPRLLEGGERNHYRIDRLKDKLGTRAMATGEVTLEGAQAELVGDLDRGFAQMTPMLNITRLHNAIASAAAIRRGLMLARQYAAQRSAFGRPLEQQPLQRQVLVQLALQAEASLLMTMRLAALMGRVECGVAQAEETLLFRVGTSLTKLYTAKQAVAAASEAIEAFGGAGYMEDTGIARLLRDAQVLPIWEGTTNVLSLDTLRVLAKPGVAEAFLDELAHLGSPGRQRVADLLATVADADPDTAQRFGRRLAFAMSEAWIAGLLREAAGRGSRETALAELWDTQAEPNLAGDRFELVVDGVEAMEAAAP